MKPRVYLIVLLLLLPLQASLFGPLSLGGITPDLGLAVLYCIGLLTGPVEATAMGNLLMQAKALGLISSLDELREVVRHSCVVKRYVPNPDSRWDTAFAKLNDLMRQE